MVSCDHEATKLILGEDENEIRCVICNVTVHRQVHKPSYARGVFKDPPFPMKHSRFAQLRCNGAMVTSGRASHVWEIYLQRRVENIPGVYEIRADQNGSPWYLLSMSVAEAEKALLNHGMYSESRVARWRRIKEARANRGIKDA